MTTLTHDCLNGRTIDYEPTPAEAKFLRRIDASVADQKVGDAELRAMIYGPENPVLSQHASGLTWVTPAAFESPVFAVLLDLLDRKRVATGALDLEKARSRYTMSVAQAADQLGLGESAIRMAVLGRRLPSWMVDGEIRLDPTSVASYKATKRGGAAPKLVVACGSHDGASLRIRVEGGEVETTHKEGGVVHGEVRKWSGIEVITGAKRAGETTYRYWRIEPGGNPERIELGPLKVAGRFTIAEQKNGKAASEAWHTRTGTSPTGKVAIHTRDAVFRADPVVSHRDEDGKEWVVPDAGTRPTRVPRR
jgi:hypothetical protein